MKNAAAPGYAGQNSNTEQVTKASIAANNVSVVKDLLTKAVKAVEGLANTQEAERATANPIPSTSTQSESTSYKKENLLRIGAIIDTCETADHKP